jgi:hypothetical protein
MKNPDALVVSFMVAVEDVVKARVARDLCGVPERQAWAVCALGVLLWVEAQRRSDAAWVRDAEAVVALLYDKVRDGE